MRVIICEFMDEAAVATLQSRFDTIYDASLVDRRDALKGLVEGADALIVRNLTRVDAELLGAAPMLRVIGRLGVGLDNIDVEACQARGIEVIPATGANALAVAEYVIAAAMVLRRAGTFSSSALVGAGKWPRGPLSRGRELAGTTMGVVGFGSIGRLTAKLARAVGMRTIGFDAQLPAASPVWVAEATEPRKFDELLAEADVVSLHVPLTPATRNLIDASRLGKMKNDAILINTARGGVIDEAALALALMDGKLGGAALDVFEQEPLPAKTPMGAVANLPNVILTPHVAGVTREANARVSKMVADSIAAFLER